MAQKVQVLLVDDIDGVPADESITFALDGVSYEIDLSAGNAAALRDALAPWVGHARKVGGRGVRTGAPRPGRAARGDAAAIRNWAKSTGRTVSERGRISAEVRTAYEAAH